jgi:hypothetical protein
MFGSNRCARVHPSGVAPEASEEGFGSSKVLILLEIPRLTLLFPHAVWPQPGCMARLRVFKLVCRRGQQCGRSLVREQPPSLCTEREDDQGPSRLLLYAPSSPFCKDEGGNAPCYPRWALNMVFPVSCYWVIRVDARALFDKGRLVARRRVAKVPVGDLLDPDPFDRVQWLGASLRWDSITNRSRWSRKCPRVPRERSPSLGHVTDVPRVIPDSACSGAAVKSLRGTTFEPLISKGLGARVLWGGCRTPWGATFEPLISRRARGPFPSPRRIFLKYPLSRSLWQERKRKKEKGYKLKQCGTPFSRRS